MELFDLTPAYPEGFSYYPDFISHEEESLLISQLSSIDLQTFLFRGYEAKRRVISYGYDYHFDSRSISEGLPIPSELNWLLERTAKKLDLAPAEIKEVLVTHYPENSVINWHRDAPPFELIAGVSLQSDCNFRLRPYLKELQNRKSIVKVPVARRSLYVMKGASREDWEHSIQPVKNPRYSITFRTLRPEKR
jgi:alkylated DNA repair dioxygenase AlkB